MRDLLKFAPKLNPVLFYAPLSGTLGFYERSISNRAHHAPKTGTMTGSGAVRYQPSGGARVNLLKVPSMETGVAGWSAANATIAQSAEWSIFGGFSAKLTCTVGGASWGAVPALSNNCRTEPGRIYTVSAYVYHTQPTAIPMYMQLYFYDLTNAQSGVLVQGAFITVQPNTPTRLWCTGAATADSSVGRFTCYRQGGGQIGDVFYVDGVLYEEASEVLPYFDGSTVPDGCWLDPVTGVLGTAHSSPSTTRAAAWIEELTTNLIANPGAEVNATNINPAGTGTTVTRISTNAYLGAVGIRVVGDGSVGAQGVIYTTVSSLGYTGSVRQFVGSIWIKGIAPYVTLDVYCRVNYTDVSITDGARTTVLLTNEWQRIVTPLVSSDPTKIVNNLFVLARNFGSGSTTFIADAAQVEEKTFATSYCAGDLGTGYSWAGTANASTSSRAASHITVDEAGRIDTRKGGIAAKFNRSATGAGGQRIVSVGNGGASDDRVSLLGNTTNNNFSLEVVTNTTATTDTPATASGGAAHVGWGGWTPESIDAQVDGSARVSMARAVAPAGVTTIDLFIGRNSASAIQYLNGFVSSVVIVDESLRSQEITKLRSLLNAGLMRWESILRL